MKIDWVAHFKAQKESGETVVNYCRKNKLSTSQWYLYKKSPSSSNDFTQVSVKSPVSKKCLSLSISWTQDGEVEFHGTTSNPKLVRQLLSGGLS